MTEGRYQRSRAHVAPCSFEPSSPSTAKRHALAALSTEYRVAFVMSMPASPLKFHFPDPDRRVYPDSMHARPIDPRDTEIEVTSPTYRVFFWERHATDGNVTPGFTSHEYEIADAQDVNDVLRWAEANQSGRTFTAYVVLDKTLVRLSGSDPTTGTQQPEKERQGNGKRIA